MSFLNSAAVDQLKNRLEEEQSSSQSVPDAKAPAAEVKQDEKLDAKPFTQDSSSSEGETDEGHQIPYKRFRSLVDTKNELKSKNLELERQLAEFKAQLESGKNQTKSEQASDDDDVDRIFQSLLNDDEDTPDERYSSLEGRLRSFEEKQAAVELEKEMSGVLSKYPAVPEAVLLQAIVDNPSVSMEKVAKQYDAWVSEIQQSAINEYTNTQRKSNAPRRPNGVGGSGPTTPAKPKDLREARVAALNYWKNLQG
jgi:hypothetical protein